MSEQPGDATRPLVVPSGIVEGDSIEDPPVGWIEVDDAVMTNADLSIKRGVAAALREGGRFSRHAAFNFNGLVWWREGRWHEAVWVHDRYVGSYAADTLEELMKVVNTQHGWA